MTRQFKQRVSLSLDTTTEGSLTLTVEHDLHPDMTALGLAFPDGLSEEDTAGFTRSGQNEWKWDGTTPDPWLRLRVDVNQPQSRGYRFVDAGSWAIVHFPPFGTTWRCSGTDIERELSYHVENEGVTSEDGELAYLGKHEERTFRAGGQVFRLVIPEETSLTDSTANIRASLSHVAENFRVGSVDDEVVVVSVPSDLDWGAVGVQKGTNGFWAVETSRVATPNNTWVHEYVHTRQDWDQDDATEWLVEGSANFYAALWTYLQGRISFSDFYEYVTTEKHSGSVLVDPSNWESSNADYTKGRRVIAALDAEIRRQTGGSNSFEDVFRRINDIDGSFTHDTFKRTVVDLTNSELQDWIENYVEGSSTPDVPDDESLFTPAEEIPELPESGETVEPEGEEESEECPICATEVPLSQQYCPTCGTALFKQCPVCAHEVRDQMYCPECGMQLVQECEVCGRRQHDSEQYCQNCGTAFENA